MNHDECLDQLRKRALQAYEDDRVVFVLKTLPSYLKRRPNDGWVWFIYAQSLRIVGHSRESLRAFVNAMRLAPDNKLGSVYAGLAMVYRNQGEQEEAEAWFARATESELGQEWGWVWFMRGANLASLEKFQLAEQCHRRAITHDDDRHEAYLNLGYVLRAQRKYTEAAEVFHSALANKADYKEAQEGLNSLTKVEEAIELAKSIPTDDGE
ncbi:MAG: tetratricopeptide repeat protein [Planctomycetes bacterium]|nr:tetratricopeptide repeat protein [Planctomycetota bacterium]